MTLGLTTIKVTTDLRARITRDAKSQRQSVGAFLAGVIDDWEREQRMAELARAVRDNPPDDAYRQELAGWDGALADGLPPNGGGTAADIDRLREPRANLLTDDETQ